MPNRRRSSAAVPGEGPRGAVRAREFAARLAADLALELDRDAVVCLSCPLEPLKGVVPLVVVVQPPLARMPLPAEGVLLVVLLDDSPGTGETSRFAAARLAAAQVPEVWLWRGPGEWLERLGRPVAGLYRERALLHPGEAVELPVPGRVVRLP